MNKRRRILFHLFQEKVFQVMPTLAWEVKEIIKNGQAKSRSK